MEKITEKNRAYVEQKVGKYVSVLRKKIPTPYEYSIVKLDELKTSIQKEELIREIERLRAVIEKEENMRTLEGLKKQLANREKGILSRGLRFTIREKYTSHER